jgi:hypothetical protein
MIFLVVNNPRFRPTSIIHALTQNSPQLAFVWLVAGANFC